MATPPGPALVEPPERLERALACPDGLASAGKTPVLLVHGTAATPQDAWSWSYQRALPPMGYPTCTVHVPDGELGDMQRSVEYVVSAIREVTRRSGRRIAVVGHSQGGFLVTFALRFWPDLAFDVDDVIGLAAPGGRGPELANLLCATGSCPASFHQFRPSSRLLAAYRTGRLPARPAYTSIVTLDDEVVFPQPQASTLERGSTIAVQAVCPARVVDHLGIVGDAIAYALAIDAITHRGPADPARIPQSLCAQQLLPGADALGLARVTPGIAAAFATAGLHGVPAEPPLRCFLDPACPKRRLVRGRARPSRPHGKRARRSPRRPGRARAGG